MVFWSIMGFWRRFCSPFERSAVMRCLAMGESEMLLLRAHLHYIEIESPDPEHPARFYARALGFDVQLTTNGLLGVGRERRSALPRDCRRPIGLSYAAMAVKRLNILPMVRSLPCRRPGGAGGSAVGPEPGVELLSDNQDEAMRPPNVLTTDKRDVGIARSEMAVMPPLTPAHMSASRDYRLGQLARWFQSRYPDGWRGRCTEAQSRY